jgi:hypothetical protein
VRYKKSRNQRIEEHSKVKTDGTRNNGSKDKIKEDRTSRTNEHAKREDREVEDVLVGGRLKRYASIKKHRPGVTSRSCFSTHRLKH